METALDTLDPKFKIPLSVQFIARYLQVGKSQTDIARIAGVTKQAVNDYIHKRYNIFEPLLDKSDVQLATQSKLIAIKAQQNLDKILDLPPDKKDMVPLNIISGTHIDKHLLLSGKATEIIENRDVVLRIDKILEQMDSK